MNKLMKSKSIFDTYHPDYHVKVIFYPFTFLVLLNCSISYSCVLTSLEFTAVSIPYNWKGSD